MIDQGKWDRESLVEMGRLNVEIARQREFWRRDEGIEVLSEMIENAKVFEKIDAEDIYEIANRNFVVDLLSRLGVFTKGNLRAIVRYLLALPLPEELEEDEDGGRG